MDIKVENADPRSSHPLVLDVMGTDDKPTATFVLKFGEFVIVGLLDNLKVVPFDEWTERQVVAEAKAKADMDAANAKAHRVPMSDPNSKLPPGSRTLGAPVGDKPKRRELEEMSKDELEACAAQWGVEVSHSWTKADIVDAIVHSRR